MNQKERTRCEAALLQARRELLAREPAKAEPARRDESRVGVDEDEQPLVEMEQAIASRRNRDDAQRLERIERALAKLHTAPDEFGSCRRCEEEIDPKRLRVAPWVDTCVDCQEKLDGVRGGRRRHAGDFDD